MVDIGGNHQPAPCHFLADELGIELLPGSHHSHRIRDFTLAGKEHLGGAYAIGHPDSLRRCEPVQVQRVCSQPATGGHPRH